MNAYREPENILRETIESILNQTYRNFELLISLDDPENQQLEKVIQEYASRDSRIRFFKNEVNLGQGPTKNRAFAQARGEYIAISDGDDVSLPDRFEKQLKFLEDHSLDLIGGVMEMIDEQGNPIYSISSVPGSDRKVKKTLGYGLSLPHPTCFGRKEVFLNIGGYRPVPLSEDYDLILRAALKGYRLGNIQEPVLKYRLTSGSVSRSNLYDQYLYMKILSSSYRKGKSLPLDEINDYVKKRSDKKKAARYTRANAIFTEMLRQKSEHEYLGFIQNGFRLIVASPQFLDKIRRFALLSLNSGKIEE